MTFGLRKEYTVDPRNGARWPGIISQEIDEIQRRSWVIEQSCASPSYVSVQDGKGRHIELRAVRCRKCEQCLKLRQAQWAYRATVEYLLAPRTWWVTLTYRGNLEPNYEHVKLAFKRMRHHTKGFRYVISEERGSKNNRLHWHCLLHCDHSLTRRKLESSWGLGNVNARLAKSGGLGGYLAKYLAKQSRIRASKHYGGECQVRLLLPPDVDAALESYITSGAKPHPSAPYQCVTKWGLEIPLSILFGYHPDKAKVGQFVQSDIPF